MLACIASCTLRTLYDYFLVIRLYDRTLLDIRLLMAFSELGSIGEVGLQATIVIS